MTTIPERHGAALEAALSAPRIQRAIADACGITPSAVCQWKTKTKKIPAERVLVVERLTGVPRSELRPDLYPPEDAPGEAA